jgi:hypothetical protein
MHHYLNGPCITVHVSLVHSKYTMPLTFETLSQASSFPLFQWIMSARSQFRVKGLGFRVRLARGVKYA